MRLRLPKLFAARPTRRPARLGVESLEDRSVPAAVGLTNGVLSITGTPYNDTVTFQSVGTQVYVKAYASYDNGATAAPTTIAGFPLAGIGRVTFDGQGGHDTFEGKSLGVPTDLYGGPGNDTLEGGSGNDTLVGGAGDDTYRFDVDTPRGSDAIYEADDAGTDTVDYSASAAPVWVDLLARNQSARSDGRVADNLRLTWAAGWGLENVIGGSGSDTIVGTNYHNRLDGGPGNDTVTPRGGNDTLVGGDGDDVLFGGPGNIRVVGGAGYDTVFGLDHNRPGPDRLNQLGHLSASLSDAGGGRKALTISGPSGLGFQLVGGWASDGAAAETFAATGFITLKSAMGDIPIYSGTPFQVSTAADDWAGAGRVTGMNWTSDGFLAGDTAAGALGWLKANLGLDLSLPGLHWGIDLGSNLTRPQSANGRGMDTAPLANAVPYFFATAGTITRSDVGGVTVSRNPSLKPQYDVAFDPADPAVFVGMTDPTAEAVLQGAAVGVSRNGWLAMPADVKPQDWGGSLFGHAYVQGKLDLSDFLKDLPLAGEGRMLFDLDANDDGVLLGGIGGGTGQQIASLFRSGTGLGGLGSTLAEARAAVADAALAVNGILTVSGTLGRYNFSLPLAEATVVYDGAAGALYARGEVVNPLSGISVLKDTPLAGFAESTATIDLTLGRDFQRLTTAAQVSFGADAAWSLTLDSRGGGRGEFSIDVGAYAQAADSIELSTKLAGLVPQNLKAALSGAVGVRAELSGGIAPDGTFTFTGEARLSLFGLPTQTWSVSVSEKGLALADVVARVGEWAKYGYEKGTKFFTEKYNDGARWAKTAWTEGGRVVEELWDTAGKRTRETIHQGANIISMKSIESGKYLQRTWDYSTGVAVNHLQVFTGTAAGVLSAEGGRLVEDYVYKGANIFSKKTWADGGVFMQELWDTTGKRISEEIWKGADIISKKTLESGMYLHRTWDYSTGTAVHHLRVYSGTAGAISAEGGRLVEDYVYHGARMVYYAAVDAVTGVMKEIVDEVSDGVNDALDAAEEAFDAARRALGF